MPDTPENRPAPSSRRLFVAGNWKMHGSTRQIAQFATLAQEEKSRDGTEIALFPPAPLLGLAHHELKDTWSLGAQDCHWQQNGAFTGEISPTLLRELGCQYVLIGHSERRNLLGETDEYVHAKLTAAFGAGLVPVLCIGETLEQYKAQETFITLASQLYHGLPREALHHEIIIAYEPVWAIGSGLTPSVDEVQHCHDHIRTFLCTHWNNEKSEATRILYGGSVKGENAAKFLALPDVDGLLVGGASLATESFQQIIQSTSLA